MPCEIGLFVKCPHPEMVEAIGLAGFDFAVVDMEHTPLGPRDLYPLVLAAECRGLRLVVRIPDRTEPYFKWCRDLGVARIQVPHVSSAADVRQAVRHTQFAPAGERGLCRFVRAADFSAMPRDAYLQQANAESPLILQLEGTEALANLEAILEALPAGAAIFAGPYDLSQALGRPGRIWDPEVVAAMDGIIEACRIRGIRVGTFTDTPEGMAHWRARGVDFLGYASDLHLLMQAGRALLAEDRAAGGEAA